MRATRLTKLSGISQAEPKSDTAVVSASFDCESNSGLSIRQETVSMRWGLRRAPVSSPGSKPKRRESSGTSFSSSLCETRG